MDPERQTLTNSDTDSSPELPAVTTCHSDMDPERPTVTNSDTDSSPEWPAVTICHSDMDPERPTVTNSDTDSSPEWPVASSCHIGKMNPEQPAVTKGHGDGCVIKEEREKSLCGLVVKIKATEEGSSTDCDVSNGTKTCVQVKNEVGDSATECDGQDQAHNVSSEWSTLVNNHGGSHPELSAVKIGHSDTHSELSAVKNSYSVECKGSEGLNVAEKNRGNRHCCYGLCNSDQRYPERNKGVVFFPFPKPKTRLEDCRMWIQACGRPHDQLNPSIITKNYFVCSKHFMDGKPTEKYPYPIAFDGQAVRIQRGHKRKNRERLHKESTRKKATLLCKRSVPVDPDPVKRNSSAAPSACSSGNLLNVLSDATEIRRLQEENRMLRSRVEYLEAELKMKEEEPPHIIQNTPSFVPCYFVQQPPAVLFNYKILSNGS